MTGCGRWGGSNGRIAMWNNDAHGLLFKSNELKLYYSGGHTWAMKLSQLPRQNGAVRIITYSLPNIEYVKEQLGRRPYNILIICNSKFAPQATEIKRIFPDIRIATKYDVHSKILLIEPKTIYITSANFGNSGWHETCIGVRSRDAHDAYVKNSFDALWRESSEIE